MTYLLDTGLPIRSTEWFANFITVCQTQAVTRHVELEVSFTDTLARYNGRGTASAFLEFDTAEDAAAFVLRFS